jgi:ABC-2 type transport system permease protein
MRTILFLIRKEFLQIFRDRMIGKAIFAVPLVQMLILVPAVTFEIREVKLCIIDMDMTSESRKLIGQLEGSTFFRVSHSTFSENEARNLLDKNRYDLILRIPGGFGRDIGNRNPAAIHASINAINATTAQLSWAYLNGVIHDYNLNIIADNPGSIATAGIIPRTEITNRFWYNENLVYSHYMLPGILAILVTAIGFLLAGLNLVKEKEAGTIEQINVTPIRKHQFITGKMGPFIIIGLFDLALGLALGKLVFRIPFEGSIGLFFLCAAIFMISVLGIALFISNFSSSQQQFMFVAYFFMMILILMSGIFTPFESMPSWAIKFNMANPMAYLIRINRMIMLKGSGFRDIYRDIASLAVLAVIFTAFAVRRYRKTA